MKLFWLKSFALGLLIALCVSLIWFSLQEARKANVTFVVEGVLAPGRNVYETGAILSFASLQKFVRIGDSEYEVPYDLEDIVTDHYGKPVVAEIKKKSGKIVRLEIGADTP